MASDAQSTSNDRAWMGRHGKAMMTRGAGWKVHIWTSLADCTANSKWPIQSVCHVWICRLWFPIWSPSWSEQSMSDLLQSIRWACILIDLAVYLWILHFLVNQQTLLRKGFLGAVEMLFPGAGALSVSVSHSYKWYLHGGNVLLAAPRNLFPRMGHVLPCPWKSIFRGGWFHDLPL